MMQLAIEATIVGAFLAIVLGAVAAAFPLTTFSSGAIAGLAIGILTHLFFEITGLNAKYCSVGHACVA